MMTDVSLHALKAERAELLKLKALVAELEFWLALRRFGWKYDPDQRRVPAGNAAGGQWTSAASQSGDLDLAQPTLAAMSKNAM